jgi:hypothetical protein
VLLTHQDAESAEQARDRILERLTAVGTGIRWMPRLLTFPSDAAEISHLLTGGWESGQPALHEAKLPA